MTNIVWLNKKQRGTEAKLVGVRKSVPPPGPNLGYAVNGSKAIDRSKDLNVCTILYVDNGLSFSR